VTPAPGKGGVPAARARHFVAHVLLLDFLAALLACVVRSAGRELVLLDEDEEEEVVVQSRPVRCCTLWGARRRKGGREGGREGRSQVEVVVCIGAGGLDLSSSST